MVRGCQNKKKKERKRKERRKKREIDLTDMGPVT